MDSVLGELERVAAAAPRVDVAGAFADHATVAGKWKGWVSEPQFEAALASLGVKGISHHIRSVSERFGRRDLARLDLAANVRMISFMALLRVKGLDTDVNRAVRDIGEPTDAAVREILMGFYEQNHPEFATDAKISRILDSFKKKGGTTGTPWPQLLWEAYAKEGVEPRRDTFMRPQAARTIQRCARGWMGRKCPGGRTRPRLSNDSYLHVQPLDPSDLDSSPPPEDDEQENDRRKWSVALAGSPWVVDLRTWTQHNTVTGKYHRVRGFNAEHKLDLGTARHLPSYWSIATSGQTFCLVDVPEKIEFFQQKMTDSAKVTEATSAADRLDGLRIHKVLRVENASLFGDYQRERDKLLSRLNATRGSGCTITTLAAHAPDWLADKPGFPRVIHSDSNELWLWHGTSATVDLPHPDGTVTQRDTWDVLARHGFDERVGGDTNGGLYGKGIYFADASTKANQYARRGANSDGHRCILSCRVAMGDPYLTPDTLAGNRRPPNNPATPGLPYDSVFAKEESTDNGHGLQFHNEYVVFAKAQVYPEYVIWYSA